MVIAKRTINLLVSVLCLGPSLPAQTEDRADGLDSPSIVFMPRKAREAFLFHEPPAISELSETYWLEAWDERELELREADDQALETNSIYEKRLGGLVTIKTRPHHKVNAERLDLRGRLSHNDRFGDGLNPDARARVRWGFGDAHDSGLVLYYRHRERQVGREREITDWATALDTQADLGRDAAFIDEHEVRDSPERHEMDEVGGRLDWWLTPRTSLTVSSVYRESDESLIEHRQEFDTRSGTRGLPGQVPDRGNQYASGTFEGDTLVSGTTGGNDARVEYQLKDEVEEKERWAVDASLRHELGERSYLQFDVEHAYKEKAEPDRQDTEFAQEETGFSYELIDDDGDRVPDFSAGMDETLDAGYGLRKLEYEDNLERQWFDHYRAFLNLEASPGWEWQAGVFHHRRRHSEDINLQRYDDEDWQKAGEQFQADAFLDASGRLDAEALRGIDPATLELQEARNEFRSFNEDFDNERRIRGAWGQVRWEPNPRVRIRGGLRYEASRGDYSGWIAQWNGSEDFGNIVFPKDPVTVQSIDRRVDHDHLLPYLRLEAQPRSNLHLSLDLRQSLQRAKLWELSPGQSYDFDKGTAPEAILGNPEIEPSVQSQIHAAANWAYAPGSLLRLYAEYWDLSDPIARASWFQAFELPDPAIDDSFEANYRFEQTINGDSGRLSRVGLNWTHLLNELPHPLDQFGLIGTLEMTRSEQDIAVNGRSRSTDLVSMPELRGTLGLYYDSPRWRVLLYGDYQDDYLLRVGEERNGASGAGDQFVDDRLTANLRIEYKLTRQIEVSAEVRNLLDSPLRFYEGSENRQTYREYTGRFMYVGAHLFF